MTQPIFQKLHADIMRLVESLEHDTGLGLSQRQLALIEIKLLAIQQDMIVPFAVRGLQLPDVAADFMRQSLDSELTELADAFFEHQTDRFTTSQLNRIHRELQLLYDRFDEALEVPVDESNAMSALAQVSVGTVPLIEILETLNDCIHVLADYDEHDGEEGTVYRRCLTMRQRLSEAATP